MCFKLLSNPNHLSWQGCAQRMQTSPSAVQADVQWWLWSVPALHEQRIWMSSAGFLCGSCGYRALFKPRPWGAGYYCNDVWPSRVLRPQLKNVLLGT